MTTRADMLFIAELSARYHRRRASFLDTASALMSLSTMIAGAGAFVSLMGEGTAIAKVATLIVTVIGLVQIIFRVDVCATQHRAWLKRWNGMLTEIRADEVADAATIARWMRERYEIDGECVQEMRALVNDCYNRTMRALNRDGTPVALRWWHRAFIQVWPFEHAFEG